MLVIMLCSSVINNYYVAALSSTFDSQYKKNRGLLLDKRFILILDHLVLTVGIIMFAFTPFVLLHFLFFFFFTQDRSIKRAEIHSWLVT